MSDTITAPADRRTAEEHAGQDPLLTAVLNLTHFHRLHERYYAMAPLEQALTLQRQSGVLKSLADRWSSFPPPEEAIANPYAGARTSTTLRPLCRTARCSWRGSESPRSSPG